ncbi:MAG: YggS family pyridoxal phosphate-dependent enzyme [Candidatus Ancaeobacter aquaticus]|nr:YggS family pyridoxal phosphate-dependent enzyme [Candidatus Ancaeobacter aquaticus]
MYAEDIQKNVTLIKRNIDEACRVSGRSTREVTLMGVTKTVDVDAIREIISCGIKDIGESKIQDATRKHSHISQEVNWHLIGHLQTNKVKHAVQIFDYIHSVDSVKLARVISLRAEEIGKTIKIFVEVNVSGEETRYGFSHEDVAPAIEEMLLMNNIQVVGLMTMAPFTDDPECARPYFKQLRELKESINAKNSVDKELSELSMGMSNDYPVAIEEGATVVRVGTALFEASSEI